MDKIRIDIVTRKRYTHDNIPLGRISEKTDMNGTFRIFEYNSSTKHPERSWRDGCYKGGYWAVFKYSEYKQDYFRVSRWYRNFGNAQRYMFEH